jgi:hypothetical protein
LFYMDCDVDLDVSASDFPFVAYSFASVRQSAKRRWYGGITKHGSRWLRRTITQCALAAMKVRDSKLRMYYLKIKSRRCHNIAITALARKLLIIIHHLLLTGEEYVEKTVKRKRLRTIRPSDLKVPIEDAVTLLNNADS